MRYAPIALFVFNRPNHTRKTLEALQNNDFAEFSDLFIFSDGYKCDADQYHVLKVREYIKTVSGFNKVTIIERDNNLGLAKSVITGVTEVVNEYGRVIVLEDDLVSCRHFLKFMNDALELFQFEERVVSINGYTFPMRAVLPETYLIKYAGCWGWATWKRGWDLFEHDGQILLNELQARNLTYRFDVFGSYPFTKMLENQIKGLNDSWAIRWQASTFLMDKLSLFPGQSLVMNIGMDNSGTHPARNKHFSVKLTERRIKVKEMILEENSIVLKNLTDYFHSISPNFAQRLISRLIDVFVGPRKY